MNKIIILMAVLIFTAGIASAEEYTYNIGAWELQEYGDYEIIIAQNADMRDDQFYLQEPMGTHMFEFGSNITIESIEIIELIEPVDITANLPDVEYDDNEDTVYIDRGCYEEKRDAYIDPWKPSYTDKTSVRVDFYPLEIIDCEAGEFRLYKKIKISIDEGESMLESVEKQGKLVPGQQITYVAKFNKIPQGEIFVEGPDGLIGSYNANTMSVSMAFAASEYEMQEYQFNYYEGDVLVASKFVREEIGWGSFDFRVLESKGSKMFPLAIEIQNNEEVEIPLKVTIMSVDFDGEVQTTKDITINAKPGKMVYYADFEVEEEDERNNDIDISAEYNGVKKEVGHNTWVRFTKEETENGLPPPPGQELLESLVGASEGNVDGSGKSERIMTQEERKPVAMSILIIIALFAIVIYLVRIYLKGD